MDEHETREFLRRQADAAERMREMNARAAGNTHRMPPMPSFVSSPARNSGNSRRQNLPIPETAPEREHEKESQGASQKTHDTRGSNSGSKRKSTGGNFEKGGIEGLLSGINLPFSDILASDPDISLIIGLLLLLYSENADRLLMCALIYILI